ncbi:MAB_1171c family putative transporter [Mangrovihabitans endophyticus]|uniref:DUF6545 domain-containing protein n=1 Tax=Mangrovihabitans endophyticus TaxID=1751298 RepID=A0A8J3C0J0_9ACTN|nr:MAB_1171c family putative transporter [Mangrovihabitans endophyticus]GGL00180.1 hypothetical protein GCM10012284_38260 [Mangrovihabitans endophyticus]
MNDVLYPVAAVVAWAAFLYRLVRGLRRDPGDPALYAICTAFALMGAIFTISTPVIWGALDRAAGMPNLSLLVSQGGVVAFSVTIQCLIIFWTRPRAQGWRHARWRVAAVVLVLTLMAVLFSLTAEREESLRTAAASYAHDPAYAAYLGIYVAAVALGVVDIMRLCLSYAGGAGRSWLTRGLRVTAAGGGLGLLYCLLRTVTLVAAQVDSDPYRWEFLVPPVSAVGAMLIVVGLTLPGLGPKMSAAAGWIVRRRAYRAIRPLWEAVRVTTPEVVLDRSGGRRGPDHRLHRRIIEIGDGLRAVREHVDDRVGRLAAGAAHRAGLTGGELAATVYAAQLRVAFAAREAQRRRDALEPTAAERARRRRWDAWLGTQRAGTPLPADAADGPAVHRSPGRDLADEVRWLAAVAAALSRSPVVADVAATTGDESVENDHAAAEGNHSE